MRGTPACRVIGGDARDFLRMRVAPHSVDAAHVYFPDPWWKKKHRRRRLFNEESADLSCKASADCAAEEGDEDFDLQECKALLEGFGSIAVELCDYDGKMASDCIADLKKADCEDLNPKSCSKVFSGPDCELTSTSE